MTFRPSNERGRSRMDYYASQILIPHWPNSLSALILGLSHLVMVFGHCLVTVTVCVLQQSHLLQCLNRNRKLEISTAPTKAQSQ